MSEEYQPGFKGFFCKDCKQLIPLNDTDAFNKHNEHKVVGILKYDKNKEGFQALWCFKCEKLTSAKPSELAEHQHHEEYIGRDFRTPDDIREKLKNSSNRREDENSILYNVNGISQVLLNRESGDAQVIEDASDMILQKKKILTLAESGQMFQFQDGVYKKYEELLIKAECEKIIFQCNSHLRNEVVGKIQARTVVSHKKMDSDFELINVKNGIINIQTGEMKSHNPDILSRIQLPIQYDRMKGCPKFIKFLMEILPDPIDRNALLEDFADCLNRKISQQKGTIFVGSGANGKTTLTKLMIKFLGIDNCTNIPLQSFEVNRFMLAELDGKLANFSTDISDRIIEHTGILKALISGDPITVERKGKNPFEMIPFCKFFVSANVLPEVKDDTDAFFRRWKIYEFKKQFIDGDENENLLDEICTEDEFSGILNLLIIKIRQTRQKGYSRISTVEQIRALWRDKADPIRAFTNDEVVVGPTLICPKNKLFQEYCGWCNVKKFIAKSDKTVFAQIRKIFPFVEEHQQRLNGIRVRVFKGISLKSDNAESSSHSLEDADSKLPHFQ